MAQIYSVPAHLKGCDVYTTPPPFTRKVENPGKFELDKCSQKELAYLAEVANYPLDKVDVNAKDAGPSE